MSINELQDEVIAEFSDFDDWMDRYQLLIDLGNEQEPLEEKYKTEQNLIEGCQSRVWLQADDVDGKIVFKAESDALIVKGIIALLIKVFSGHTPDEILNADLYFIDKIGLKEHLSPTRSNGLLSMVKQIRMYALAFKAKEGEVKTSLFYCYFWEVRWFMVSMIPINRRIDPNRTMRYGVPLIRSSIFSASGYLMLR